MKKTILFFVGALILMSCADNSSEKKVLTSAELEAITGKYIIDTTASKLKWQGEKPTGVHFGYVNVESGFLQVEQGKLIGGEFTINLNSITASESSPEKAQKLEKHLKNADFFNTAIYPKAKLHILSVDSGIVQADLSIKDKTKSITFPADIVISKGGIKASAKFNINRTDWGIFYGSGSFTDWAKDKIIADEIEFEVQVSAIK